MTDEKTKMNDEDEPGPEELVASGGGVGIRHLQMLMMTLCATVMYVMRSSMSVTILAMTDTKANHTGVEVYIWDEPTRGIILSSFFWGYMLMQIPAGILAKMFGGKSILLLSLLANGVLCLSTPFLAKIGDWVAVVAVRVAMGLTQACLMPAQHTLLGQWAPLQERTRFSTIAYAGIQIGTIMTMPLCGILSNTYLGWRLTFYSMGSLALGTAALWWMFTASSPSQHRFIKVEEIAYIEDSLASSNEVKLVIPWRRLLRCVPLYAIMVAHIGLNWCFIIFLVQSPTYLKSVLQFDMAKGSALSALPFLAMWIVSTVCSFIADKLFNSQILSLTQSRKIFNSIASFGCGIGLIALSFITKDSPVWGVAILCFSTGISGAAGCGYMLNHIDLSPRYGGIMYGMTNCAANLIGLLAPLVTGFIVGSDVEDPARWRIVFWLAAGIIIASNIFYCVFGSSQRQVWDERRRSSVYSLGQMKRLSIRRVSAKEERRYSFPAKT